MLNNEYIRKNKKFTHKTITSSIIYNNIDTEKVYILKNNKGKSGIYRWTNLINLKSYIGSSNDLTKRFRVYYSKNSLSYSNMVIYKAIIKYGYINFKLEILEYCPSCILLKREQYYIDKFKPEYNILKIAGSSYGFKHKAETLEIFKTRKISGKTLINLAEAAINRVLSEETRAKISKARKGIKLSKKTRTKLSIIATKRNGIAVEITNTISGEILEYSTLTQAALIIGVSRTSIKKAMDSGKVLKKIYLIKSINV